jgi:hypothetical protein
MLNRKIKVLLWFTILAVIMACAPIFSSVPPLPTLDPGAINTFIVQTANAASTQTVAAAPTSTSTATLTSTPRFTNTPEPTATNTFIWILVSPTNPVSASLTAAAITSNKNHACLFISVTPANGTSFDSRKNFEATWRVKNIGKKEWNKDDTDFVYVNGDKFHKESGYDFKKTLEPGVTGDLTVAMQAPKRTGTYTTNWAVRIGSDEFCKVSLRIAVR